MKNYLLFATLIIFVSCGLEKGSKVKDDKVKPVVVTVNYPLYYFAGRIGGELIQLEYPIPADVDPAYWIPDDDALEIYQSADIIIANGADYAKWMNNVSLPSSRIVNTSSSVKQNYIPLKDVSTHSHGSEGEHEHTGYAFTTWLDFEIAALQAQAVKDELVKKFPDNKEELEANYEELKKDLLNLHKLMKDVALSLENQPIIGSHPVFQYLAKAYSLNIHSVHFEPDEMPSDDQWKEFELILEHHPARVMFWEDKPMPGVKEMLNKKEIKTVVFNPCSNKIDDLDFLEAMMKNINNLSKLE